MKDDRRGPYSRIMWFCNDGTTQNPVAYACSERGGGVQHAEYSADRTRLAELGWSVGTIFAALRTDELLDADRRDVRLRELALERYLIDVDDGWVLRQARYYRGRVQVEDEVYWGRELLLQLLEARVWEDQDFLLLRETARVIPHGEDTDIARSVRRQAIELASIEPVAERWRVEIHANPSPRTAGRLRAWLAEQARDDVRALGEELAAGLDLLYGPTGRHERIEHALKGVRGKEALADLRRDARKAMSLTGREKIAEFCGILAEARPLVLWTEASPRSRLALLDAILDLETEIQLTFQELTPADIGTRRETIALVRDAISCAYGSGLLSAGERTTARRALNFGGKDEVPLDDYRRAISRLKRVPGWALGTIRYTFAEALIRYGTLEPRAGRFSDDTLRGSVIAMLGTLIKTLSLDLEQLSGNIAELAGDPGSSAMALNAGVGIGTLRIYRTVEELAAHPPARTEVVVVPETVADLTPVTGILTLGEGNAVSHVQLLARNFAIPNVAVDQPTVDRLVPLEGSEVILVVDGVGNVVLRSYNDETKGLLSSGAGEIQAVTAGVELPSPRLDQQDLLPLGAIGRALSGRVVGPKAANLGELNRLFPRHVAPAVALPFGVYARHLEASGISGRIAAAFGARNAGELSQAQFSNEMETLRKAVAALRLDAKAETELRRMFSEEMGDPETTGVFVRSDTNVEDLPQFTGAGLNETVPNVVGFSGVLAAIPRVWGSVLSPRALAWRSTVLADPARIYSSVLVMQSVPSTKSGVMITANLAERGAEGFTVATAWGVGGAVAGETSESIVILPNRVESVTEAKVPYQRGLAPAGGMDWLPATAGPVLLPAEIEELRRLAREVGEKYAPVLDEEGVARPWDIEFGFVKGHLALFQIRPFVERSTANADAVVRRLVKLGQGTSPQSVAVRLSDIPGSVPP